MNSPIEVKQDIVRLFTIGFSKKSAKHFFRILQREGIRKIIDIRLNNVSQLAGFTKKNDLEFFLQTICQIRYEYRPEFTPTKAILDGYKSKKLTWSQYDEIFTKIMIERQIETILNRDALNNACLLCSEPTADMCHRRLVAEYLQSKLGNIEVRHL